MPVNLTRQLFNRQTIVQNGEQRDVRFLELERDIRLTEHENFEIRKPIPQAVPEVRTKVRRPMPQSVRVKIRKKITIHHGPPQAWELRRRRYLRETGRRDSF